MFRTTGYLQAISNDEQQYYIEFAGFIFKNFFLIR